MNRLCMRRKKNFCLSKLLFCGGHLQTAKLLLNLGANIEAMTKFGETPFLVAKREGHLDIIFLLLQADPILVHSQEDSPCTE